ncbi:MAG: GlsB/YeaQ/YmgE family stress response membrane protein [Isosphaeraceae bacterium]|nr:GlsB/YeaQ/YmgE family stress response membrane protein [Isosphaeraceae bacterium]
MVMSMLFAEIALFPGGVIAWIVVGLVAGWLAGLVMKGGGYGVLGDILVGLIGALVGGFVLSYFVHGTAGFWGSILVAFLGACLCIAIVRAFAGRPAV